MWFSLLCFCRCWSRFFMLSWELCSRCSSDLYLPKSVRPRTEIGNRVLLCTDKHTYANTTLIVDRTLFCFVFCSFPSFVALSYIRYFQDAHFIPKVGVEREVHINWSMVTCQGSTRSELPPGLLALCRRTLGGERHRYAFA